MRDAATPWAGTAANAAVVRNRTASDACAVTDGIVYQTRNTYVRSQAGALMPSDALQRVVRRNRAQASACALADGFAYSVTEPALVTSGISMHIIPLGNGNIDSRYPRAYGDMLYIADGAAMSDGVVSTVSAASGLDKNLHIGHDPDGDIDSTYVYTPPVNHAPVWTNAPTALTFSQGVGGTQAFGPFASDPDADTLTFSLVGTAYSGISINATTGLLTVTASAAAAVRALAIRVSDPAGLFADHACTVTVVAQTGSIKWNPGFYIYLAPSGGHMDSAATRTADLGWFQLYASDPKIKGFYIQKYLSAFESDQATPFYGYTSQSGGVNYGGFAMVDYYLGLCATYNKRLCIEFEQTGFPNTPIPAYWVNQGWLDSTLSYAPRAKIETTACRDRFAAMLQAYGTRYNGSPRLEVIGWEESTVSSSNTSAYVAAWKYLLSQSVSAFPNTLVRSCQNYTINSTVEKDVLQYVESLNAAGSGCVIVGGPDHEYGLSNPASPSNAITANRLWRGSSDTGVTWKDVRGQQPWWGETQERGFTNPSYTMDSATNICTYHIDTMKASHVTFLQYTDWSAVYAAISARSGITNATAPTCLTGRTATGGT